ncbi:MAG TPA: hypothetical protein VF175_00805 [Lacipirellula sp.]
MPNPFDSGYTGWIDGEPGTAANWRLNLHQPTLMDTNNANPPTSGATAHSGVYESDLLIQNNFLAPANYELSATMRTNDDDIFGLVWNYQDPDNYFRVGIRTQAAGSFGGTQGVSVQKVVNGVLTQLEPSVVGPGAPTPVTQDMINNRTPIDMKVVVNGANYQVLFNNTQIAAGSDSDLVAGRKIGFQSWAQVSDTDETTDPPFWGTEVDNVSVKQGATTLYNQSFAARPVAWRQVVMTNAEGLTTATTSSKAELGNFGVDVNDPWILQQGNGFVYSTPLAAEIDFIGPGVVVDEPGATGYTNYQMQVRMGATDNDGVGVLVRAQDDNNFYRITFTSEALDTTPPINHRAPQGLSVQKYRNGVWSELYRDDQANPLFVYTPGANGTDPSTGLPMFDLSVGAVGNSLKIQVRDHEGNVVNYPLITDNSDPILSGSVGLHTWGTDNVYYTGYGGNNSAPLLTTLSAFTAFDVTVNRSTGNITLTNNSGAPVQIRGLMINSVEGGLNEANWLSVANNYDEPPGNGSVDPNDPWTILSSTSLSLSEREQSPGGDGATLSVGESINLGNVWRKSQIEDVNVAIELFNGSFTNAGVSYSGAAFHRSDLNVDGLVNANDWSLFFPNLLADLSSLTGVQRALAGDVDLDGDNDIDDFALFKADFDAANGVGAFQAMLQGVPEPASALLLACGGAVLAIRRRWRTGRTLPLAMAVTSLLAAGTIEGKAQAVDLTTFSSEAYPPAASFGAPVWNVTPTSASLNSNADATVLYSPDSALNKRILATLTPGSDDDVVGFVLGFEPGDAQIFSSADYLLIDWKGATQNGFNFSDSDPFNFHHDQTAGGDMSVGLALNRVTGSPTADEFWQHADLPENPSGGVAELARGATLGSAAYNRAGGSHLFDITYTSTNITVRVDGVEQLNVNGSFPDGRFGLYSAWQGPTATFSDVEIFPAGFAGLSATIDRTTGDITLRNTGTEPVQFDYYQFDSGSGSLNVAGWDSLSDQNFQPAGAGIGQTWDEAGGSDASQLGEAYLQSMSTLNAGASVSLGNAYNNGINGEDLTLTYRLPSGFIIDGAIEYIGEAPTVDGDYDSDGDVDGGDLLAWQRQLGGPGSADGNGNNVVDGPDLTVWENNFGAGTSVAASATVIPEPASIWLGVVMALGVAGICRRTSADE